MDASDLYDADFVLWTEQQAAAVRSLAGVSNSLDAEHLAEEIEDLGKRDIREVESYVRLILVHVLKILLRPASPTTPHWRSEVVASQASAVAAFAPSMRQRIAMERQWSSANRIIAAEGSEAVQLPLPLPTKPAGCPVTLDDVLSPQFDVDGFLRLFTASFDHSAAP